jgi:hypothetical protein
MPHQSGWRRLGRLSILVEDQLSGLLGFLGPTHHQIKTDTIGQAGIEAAKQNMLDLLEIQAGQGDLAAPKQDYN